jgi:exodeoxyribonuclease V alpha subunit
MMRNNREHRELTGQIERITYFNAENGYTIAKVRPEGGTDLVTVVGTLYTATPGETVRFVGYWQTHPKFGEQFQAVSSEPLVPATVKGIERYLGSGMIKGVGPVMAKRLVAAFGGETLSVIENDPDRLRSVEGFGEKRIEMIRRAWEEQRDIRHVMVFLQGQGVSPGYAVKIFRQYGPKAVQIVRENPYRLAADIFGIGFLTADRIAEGMGIPRDSEARIRAGILHALGELGDEGHVFCPFELLVEQCSRLMEVSEKAIGPVLKELAAEQKIVIEDHEGEPVYLERFHTAELAIVRHLEQIIKAPKQLELVDEGDWLTKVQREMGINLSPEQVEAVEAVSAHKVVVVTGGPGTGKTTIINCIIRFFRRRKETVLLAAPTGRAAKRMTEATGQEAKTIHRLLEFSPVTGTFRRDDTNPLDAGLLIIDEASMIDTLLMHNLLAAVPARARLVLVGDVDQLPSVGPGSVLKDIIESEAFPVMRLNEIFRQSRESLIIVNAHRVNRGEMPEGGREHEEKRDFFFISESDPDEVGKRIIALCLDKIPSRFGFDPREDIQVITPMHRGTAGVANLNKQLQEALNPGGEELLRGGRVLRRGDKVMQLRNNYDKEVFNGDIGRIVRIDKEMQEVTVNFDGTLVAYDYPELDEVTLAYAISVHKAQGSEYPAVIMPVLTQHYMLLQRNLLYTGISRGKRLVVLIGTKKALAIAVKNNRTQLRFTGLARRLRALSAKQPRKPV